MTVTQSASGAVADAIEESIRTRHMPAGERIGTKTELLERFSVAPATLNEALRILRERRIVVVKPGPKGGIFVAEQPPLSRLALEIVDLRSKGLIDANNAVEVLDGLDNQVMLDAVRHRTDADVADLEALHGELEAQWHTPGSEAVNWKLHRRIANITPNLMLRSFYQNLVDYILADGDDPTFGISGFTPDSDDRLRIHLDLIDVIVRRDEARIEEVLAAHRMVKG